MTSLYECDACNERFSTFEDDLGKMTFPARSIGGVLGKNGVPKLTPVSSGGSTHKPKMELKGSTIQFSHEAGDIGFIEEETNKTLTIAYVQQKSRFFGLKIAARNS